MKCNSRTISSLSPAERKRLIDDVYKSNKAFLEEELDKMKVRVANNLFKIFVVTANQTVGLGAVRIERILQEMNKRVFEITAKDKDDWWALFDRECKQVLGKDMYYKYFTDNELNLGRDE